jgi:hypothetical protein
MAMLCLLLNCFVLSLIQCSRRTGSKNGEAKFDEGVGGWALQGGKWLIKTVKP